MIATQEETIRGHGAGTGGKKRVAVGVLWPGETPRPDQRSPWAWLMVLMAVAAVLRGIALNQQLWYDEIVMLLQTAREPLGQIVTTYDSQNKHMLYSILARISIVLFGEHEWTLRLPAVLFGVACVPALYFCARQVTRAREAWLACALLVVSYHHVWFSQNARGYTGMVFWTLLGTYCFIRGAREEKDRAAWAWYGVVMALGLYTHLTMAFVVAGHGLVYLWLLAARRRELGGFAVNAWRPWIGFVLTGVLALLLYAPVLPSIFQRTVGPAAAGRVKLEWANPLWTVLETMKGLAAGTGGKLGFVVLPVAGGILLAGLWSYWRESRHAVGLMVVPGVITGGVMLMLEHNLWPRFFFFAIGFGFLLLMRGAIECAAFAAARLGRSAAAGLQWGTALAALMIVASAGTLRSAYIYPKQDFEGALRYVEAQKRPGDAVVLAGLAKYPYQSYFGRGWPAVETRAQIEAARPRDSATWLLYTFPVYLRSMYPEVWNAVQSDFAVVKVFRGTIGDADVVVCRSKSGAPGAERNR